MKNRTIFVVVFVTAALATSSLLLAQVAPPASQSPPVVETPKQDWGDIDDRMVFLTTQLASVETSLAAVDKGLRVAGYQQLVKQDAANNARKGNDLMNRNMGMPTTIGWEHFYGETADKFFYHPTDRNSSYHTTTLLTQRPAAVGQPGGGGVPAAGEVPVQQRPPQFDYIYKANADAQQRAEEEVAKLGGQKGALLDRRSSLEAEQNALWCKIAFHAVANRELLIKPLYCFDLKSTAAEDTAAQHLVALRAAMDFLRIANKLTEEAEPAVDQNQVEFFRQLQAAVSSARKEMDSKLVRQSSIVLDLGETTTIIGKLSAVARRMENISKNITDSYALALDGAKGGDDQRKNTFRAMLQESLVNFAEAILAGDECVNTLARDWKVLPDPDKPVTPKDVTSVQQSSNAGQTPVTVAPESGTTASKEPSPERQPSNVAPPPVNDTEPAHSGVTGNGADPQQPEPRSSAPAAGEGWTVLFRSHDPRIWNTDTNRGVNDFAVLVATAPQATQWLRLTCAANGKSVIIPVTYDALAKKAPLDSVIGWNGSAIYRNGGSHLGIFMNSMKFTTRGDIMITQGGAGGRDSRGWGFGRQARVDKEQGYSWEGNALKGPVAFEIAVKAGELTDEEQKVLLTDSKIQQP